MANKNLLKSKDKRVVFIQSILKEIHDEITFSERDHKYKVEIDLLTQDGFVPKKVSPFSVSSFVANNFGHFNEKNWEKPARNSGIAKEDLIYNRLLAQMMGCIKGSIIHNYLENYALGNKNIDLETSELTETIRNETKFNFYPNLKKSQNLQRRLVQQIDFGKINNINQIVNEVEKTLPKQPEGVLSLQLDNLQDLSSLNSFIDNFAELIELKGINNIKSLTNLLKSNYNFPENMVNEFNNLIKDQPINKDSITNAFANLKDNDFLITKEFLYKMNKDLIINKFIKLNQTINNHDLSAELKTEQVKLLKSDITQELAKFNKTFLLNKEITAKTLTELEKEEYRLNKDIKIGVIEVFENLNAANMIDEIKNKGIIIIAVEQKMSIGPAVGTSDLIGFNEQGTIVTLDYKTNKGHLSKESLEHYSLQLRIYDYMLKELVSEKITNDPKLQKKVEKLYGCNWEQALATICKKEDPILIHISGADKIRPSDVEQMKFLKLRELRQTMNGMMFTNESEKITFFNTEINKAKTEIESILDNQSSSKLIYAPEYCEQYDINNKTIVKVDLLVNNIFNVVETTEVREPKNHSYSKSLDAIIPNEYIDELKEIIYENPNINKDELRVLTHDSIFKEVEQPKKQIDEISM